MESKFQSSFIPKDSSNPEFHQKANLGGRKESGGGGLFGFLAKIIFAISIIAAVGVFGYKFYLKYSIDRMKEELEVARVNVEPDTVSELVRINNRILSTKELIANHFVLSPFFEFLETSTARTVRFTDIDYLTADEGQGQGQGIEITLSGEANNYGALAHQAEIFKESPYLTNQIFSDLNLDSRGNVLFTFSATVSRELLSYRRRVEQFALPVTSIEEVASEEQVIDEGNNQDTTI